MIVSRKDLPPWVSTLPDRYPGRVVVFWQPRKLGTIVEYQFVIDRNGDVFLDQVSRHRQRHEDVEVPVARDRAMPPDVMIAAAVEAKRRAAKGGAL